MLISDNPEEFLFQGTKRNAQQLVGRTPILRQGLSSKTPCRTKANVRINRADRYLCIAIDYDILPAHCSPRYRSRTTKTLLIRKINCRTLPIVVIAPFLRVLPAARM